MNAIPCLSWFAWLSVSEGIGRVIIPATRSGGSEGNVALSGVTTLITAQAADLAGASLSAFWANGVDGAVNLSIDIADDALPEPTETLQLTLASPSGGLAIGAPATVTIEIIDNDQPDLLFGNGFEN